MRKTTAGICVFTAAASLLAGCRAGGFAEGEKEVKIGVLRTADSIPLYVAEEEELFEKYGIGVELVEFGSASDQSKAMEAGAIDLMMTDMVVQCLLEKGGTEVRTIRTALGARAAEGKFLVVASPGADVSSAAGLEGASVAIAEGTMMEYLVDSYCRELGVNLDDVEKVNIPSLSLRYETVMEGTDVDCAILPEPLGDYALMNGAKCVVDDSRLENNYSISVILAAKEWMDADRETAEQFADAYDEAVGVLNGSPDTYKELVFEVANVPEDMRDSYAAAEYPANAVPGREEVERVVEWMKEKGLLQTPYAYEEVVEDSFLNTQ